MTKKVFAVCAADTKQADPWQQEKETIVKSLMAADPLYAPAMHALCEGEERAWLLATGIVNSDKTVQQKMELLQREIDKTKRAINSVKRERSEIALPRNLYVLPEDLQAIGYQGELSLLKRAIEIVSASSA